MLQGLLIAPHPWLCTVEFCAYFPAGIAFRSLQDLNANTCVLGGRNLFPHKLGTSMELCEIRFFLLRIANRFSSDPPESDLVGLPVCLLGVLCRLLAML